MICDFDRTFTVSSSENNTSWVLDISDRLLVTQVLDGCGLIDTSSVTPGLLEAFWRGLMWRDGLNSALRLYAYLSSCLLDILEDVPSISMGLV